MSDSPIDGRGFTVRQLFGSGNRFQLDAYQREYSWSRNDVRRLLEDLFHRFAHSWKEDHDRTETSKYTPYFLGPYVYHQDGSGTYLVDGQQRITTLHLLLIQLCHLLNEQGLNEEAEELRRLTSSMKHGRRTFTVDIPERAPTLEAILKGDESYRPPANASLSIQNLWERSRDLIEDFPPALMGEALPYFQDWLLDRVCLVGIQALDRSNGWEIFETMNDRGRRLSPVDLLKSFLLDNAPPAQRDKLNQAWRQMITRLWEFEGTTGSDFVKTFLVAKHADLTSNSTESGEIDRSFHEWIRGQTSRLGLKRPSDFSAFISPELTRMADRYCTLLHAAKRPEPSMPAVYYNAVNGLSQQFQLILATVRSQDDDTTFKSKARLVSSFLDIMYVREFIRGNAAHPSQLDPIVRTVTPLLRTSATAQDVASVLSAHIPGEPVSDSQTLGLSNSNKRQIRYLLARITAFVQYECKQAFEIEKYLDEDEPWQIEHIWEDHYERYVDQAANRKVFDTWRNRFGALLLLHRSDNASYRDAPYSQKVSYYRGKNLLAASLHPDTHKRNPNFRKFVERHKLGELLRPFPSDFNRQAIEVRQELYRRLIQIVWDPKNLGFDLIAIPRANGSEQRSRAWFGVEVADLMQAGLVVPNAALVARYKGTEHIASVLQDGRIKVATGETFTSLSGAGAFVQGGRSCPGWDFWHLRTRNGDIKMKQLRAELLRRKQ